jgi:hypothetical protein
VGCITASQQGSTATTTFEFVQVDWRQERHARRHLQRPRPPKLPPP